VVVYLRSSADRIPSSESIEEMKHETAELLDSAGYRVAWRSPADSNVEVVDASLVVVELRGACTAPARTTAAPVAENTSLASTAVSNGRVLPFSWVECETLSKMLAPAIAVEPAILRDHLFGRALGRLISHELFHILTRTQAHDEGGIGKASFSVKNLLAERFAFESGARAKLREAAPPSQAGETVTTEGIADSR